MSECRDENYTSHNMDGFSVPAICLHIPVQMLFFLSMYRLDTLYRILPYVHTSLEEGRKQIRTVHVHDDTQ